MAATPAPTEAHTQTADLGASATVNPPQNEQSHGVSDETVTGTTVAAEPKPVWNPLAMARSGLAIFSTDLGRRPKRGPLAPVQPCIAHGDTLRGVVDFALRLQSTYPREYMFFFPLCGYTIFDLWDRADIHLYSPTFLEEVLSFITQDNVQHAQKYAAEWSQNHRDRLHVVLEVEYDQDRPLDIVDAIFVNGETNRFPPEFLWHVAHIMRYGMCVMSDRSKAVPPAVVAGAVAKAADSDAGNLNPRTDPAAEQMSKITPSNKQLPMAPPPGIAPQLFRESQMMSQPPEPLVPQGVAHVQESFTPQVTQYPLRQGYPPQAPVYPIAGPPNPRTMNPLPFRNEKRRNGRSSSYGQPPQPPQPSGWAENLPMAHPGQQSRHTSGTMSNMTSPQLQHPFPAGEHLMRGGHTHPMGHPAMMNSPQLPAPLQPYQASYQPGMQMDPRMPPAHGVGAPVDYRSGYYANNMPQRVGSIGEMTNVMRPFNGNMHQGNPNAGRHRRDSRSDRQPPGPRLYNPYPKEKPEFSNIPPQSRQRKGSQNVSYCGTMTQARRSSGAHQPSFGPGAFESGAQSGGMYRNDWGQPSYPSEAHPLLPATDLSDPAHGCGSGWIGPENTAVTELIMFSLAPMVTEMDLWMFFRDNAGVDMLYTRLKTDKNENKLAHVGFNSVDDARKALGLDQSAVLLGRHVTIKVPERYYTATHGPGYRSINNFPQANRAPFGPPPKTANGWNNGARPNYSPQDARSDLTKGQILGKGTTVGSPETRKGKKRNKSPNKNESQSPEKKQGASPTKKPIAASQVEAQIAPDRKDKQLPKEAAEPRPQGFSEAKSTAAVETTIKVAEESKKPDGKSTGETKFKVPEVPASPTKPAPQLKGDTKAAEDQPGPKLDVAEKDAIRKQSEPKQASVTKQKAPETQPGPKVDVAKVVITKQSEPKQKTATEQKAQEAQQGPKLDAAKDNIPKQPEHTQKSATKLKVPISAKDTHGDAKAPALKETEKPVDPKSEIEPKVKVTESVDAAKTKAPQPKDDVKPAAPVSDKKAQLPATKPSTQSKAKPVETKTEAKAEVSLPKSNAKVVLPIEKPIGKPETSVQAPGDRSGDIKGTPGPVATATKEKIVQREASPVAVGPSATATSKDPNAVQKQPAEAGTDAPPTLPQEDAGSDEDQKNETSFHSAKEAQSDSGNEEPVGSSGKLSVQPAQLPENRAVTGAKQDMSKDALGPAKAGGQSDSALAKPSSSVDKKPGAKQTEAIYPFAKSKAKQKAEKARQKKEKKKEKEKAKNEKLAPASKSNKSVDKSVDATPTGTPPLSPSTKSTETSRGQDKDETQDGESKHDGGKDNAPLAAPTKQEVPPRPQDGGVTSYETELVTANGETVPSAETDGAESSHPSATAQSTESTAIAGAEQPGIINEEVAHPKGTDSGSTDAARESNVQAESVKNADEVEASVAEKAPAGNDSLQTSTLYVPIPSPTAADFHTPLETPTALSIPTPEQQPTSSKKKNKKKKKKNAQTAAPEAPAVQPPTETVPHTFSEQIRQIEMLKEGGAPGTSTSASASASASAPAFQPRRNVNVLEEIGSAKVLPFPSRFPNVHELTEAQKSRSILGDVLGFMREKPGMHDLDPEKLKPWNQVNRMVRLSREDVEQIMDRPLEMEMEMDVAGAEVAGGRGGGGKGDGEGGGE